MAITLTHIFEPTDANVLDPKKHRKLANECPAMKLPGVIGSNIYRHTGKRIMFGDQESVLCLEMLNSKIMLHWILGKLGGQLLKEMNGAKNFGVLESILKKLSWLKLSKYPCSLKPPILTRAVI